MKRGSSLLLPRLDTACSGRLVVDTMTKSPSLNERVFPLPCLSAFRFCASTDSAMASCTKRLTASRSSTKFSAACDFLLGLPASATFISTSASPSDSPAYGESFPLAAGLSVPVSASRAALAREVGGALAMLA